MRKYMLISAALLAVIFAGCKTLDTVTKAGTGLAVSAGVLSQDEAQSIQNVSSATGQALEKFTPEQEHYLGRTLAATILSSRKPFYNDEINGYLNLLGQGLAMYSDKPETFKGYRFITMDTDEINAFATPGGFILVSRGLLRCCKTEDAVAAVLAHEIGHVQLEHGVKAIKGSRLTNLGKVAVSEGVKTYAGEALNQAKTIFGSAIGDMTDTLVNNGYAKKQEYQADEVAVTILKRSGYNPAALVEMLTEMDKLMDHKGGGFAKTHPDPKDRIEKVSRLISESQAPQPPARKARFEKALSRI